MAQAAPPFNSLPWNFHVVQDDSINAFAIPGGHVYVNTGLIRNANNASQLAGVMAHEISHVLARHSTEQLSRQYGLSVIAGAVLGQDPGALSQIAAQIIAGGALARFSRDAEREADNIGIQAMAAAGYNPNGMAAMFEKLTLATRQEPVRLALRNFRDEEVVRTPGMSTTALFANAVPQVVKTSTGEVHRPAPAPGYTVEVYLGDRSTRQSVRN